MAKHNKAARQRRAQAAPKPAEPEPAPVYGRGETGKYLVEAKKGKQVVTINKRTGQYLEQCRIISFKKPKPVTTVRCKGADARSDWSAAAKKRIKKQCRNKKKRFVKCRSK